ncbi:hypothetical protein N5W20_03195 [Candidatus Kirkpatrickella diaphorinae]|uniref:Uncharacterized protein n=1 Tax=Candidatus Kirkpatrickella diaphorinae TaxID=2984322 RepID=A0ABY6GKN8_9PROT|nr:hypothetical protein [Candidatus Kirkpatrickella diaphorinae]UYH51879.1 hypothetical protein N5W20_03195 [Candidatus Kirkpatrickella diaphorinae]
MMKNLSLFAAVAALALPVQAFAAHHMNHHSNWKSAHHCKHNARHCMTRHGATRGSDSTEALNARSLDQARMGAPASQTPPGAPMAKPTLPSVNTNDPAYGTPPSAMGPSASVPR